MVLVLPVSALSITVDPIFNRTAMSYPSVVNDAPDIKDLKAKTAFSVDQVRQLEERVAALEARTATSPSRILGLVVIALMSSFATVSAVLLLARSLDWLKDL